MKIASVNSDRLLDYMFSRLESGQGGWIITANLDFLRRYFRDRGVRELYDAADVIVADGMPLLWAARLQGDILPERIAGSTIIWTIVERAANEKRSIYLLGGERRARLGAKDRFTSRYGSLKIAGHSGPMIDDPPSNAQLKEICNALEESRPDIVLCGFGSPKQEYIIRVARDVLPHAWMIGIGISFSFITGEIKRAPHWMQKSGLEWSHRLAQEPNRLAKRYLIDDLPFAFRLFAVALRKRVTNRYQILRRQ